jgi:hypothetical protein
LTFSGTVKLLALAGFASLVLTSTALAGPAGSEYLPKVPSSGAHSNSPSNGAHSSGASASSSSSGETDTSTLPTDQGSVSGSASDTSSDGKPSKPKKGDRNENDKKSNDRAPVVPLGDSGGGGGDSSGSLLLNPIVLLMIVAVLAAAVGMILRRRQTDEDATGARDRDRGSRGRKGVARTPDGEIIGPGPGPVER